MKIMLVFRMNCFNSRNVLFSNEENVIRDMVLLELAAVFSDTQHEQDYLCVSFFGADCGIGKFS